MVAKKTVLIVEDEDSIRELLVAIFTEENCIAIGANTAEKGLELLEKIQINLITVDLQLPGMGGIEFLRCLQESQKNIPVVVISANTFLVPETYTLTLVKKIIPKPFDINEVVHLAEELC